MFTKPSSKILIIGASTALFVSAGVVFVAQKAGLK